MRRALAVAALLVAAPGPAAADCAWVLWSEMPPGSGRWRLSEALQVAFEHKAECDRALRDLHDARALSADEAATKGERLSASFLVCLPASVDPRAPKTGMKSFFPNRE